MKHFSWIFAVAILFFASCGQQSKNNASEAGAANNEAEVSEVAAENTNETGAAENESAEEAELQQFTDIALPGTDNKVFKVSDYVAKNKLTLIDFWASWCGPCRAEMPYVVKAYSAFHKQGFEIVGVSLDQDREAWLNAIRDLQLLWPQMSDLKGWECAGAQAYGVQSIPANVLIDQKGRIVASDLRGDALYRQVEKLLAE